MFFVKIKYPYNYKHNNNYYKFFLPSESRRMFIKFKILDFYTLENRE